MSYSLCGVGFHLVCTPPSETAGLQRILKRLFSLVPNDGRAPADSIEISIRTASPANRTPDLVSGELVFEAAGLSAIRTEHGYHLQSYGSSLTLDLRSGRAAGLLTCAFMEARPEDQRGLFLFAFLLLLSGRGLYGLHAGGVSWNGHGLLLAGHSGCGKTTLTCALARSGWQYLSDDAVLLRRGPSGVKALAFGLPFHCSSSLFRFFPEFARGAEPPAHGKHLVDVSSVYPGQALLDFRPEAILFPEISSAPTSRLIPLDCTATLLRLLGEGAGLLHNRDYMAAQMEILGDLARSARGFRLLHGADVHNNPFRVSALLQRIVSRGLFSQLPFSQPRGRQHRCQLAIPAG
jgi:hypothetical protein